MSAQSANVTAAPAAATSVAGCGSHRDGGAEVCVIAAVTTQRAVTARTVRRVSSGTRAVPKLHPTPVNVRPLLCCSFPRVLLFPVVCSEYW